MSLRLQLLALAALTLLLPLAGIRMVQQVEVSLRSGLEGLLIDAARARIVTMRLGGSEALDRAVRTAEVLSDPLYAHALTQPPGLDGFRGDWQYRRDFSDAAAASRALTFDDGSRLWIGENDNNLHLFVDVVDDDIVRQGVPGERPHGDRIVLVLGAEPARRETLLLASSATGTFRAQPTAGGPLFEPSGRNVEYVLAAWQDTGAGYAIEARLPLWLVDGALGVAIIDSDDAGRSAELVAATWNAAGLPNAIVRESDELNRILRPFTGGEDRTRIVDAEGWVLADTGPLDPLPVADDSESAPLMERFFRYVLRRDDPAYETQQSPPGRIGDPALRMALGGQAATAWYRQGAEVSVVVTAAVPVDPGDPRRGAVVLEQASDPILTLTNQAMMRLMPTTGLIIVLAAGGLLAYASLLSFRVSRLARAAESALGPRGEINPRLPGMKGRDELGDLSRSFADLLGRLRDYTEYLQSLKSKLSHELRTPLAIVATSLDNLEHETRTEPARDYLKRLRHGAERLESILQAMTAATRVEQAITQTGFERFDLAAVVSSCAGAYADVYPDRQFAIDVPSKPLFVDGSAELIEQMLDKLVDNAAGFAAEGTAIGISLEAGPGEARLEVVNRGPLLPESMRHQLFDSLVSVREKDRDRPHLGLGLYIVMLVAEFHTGKVSAENLADGTGVRMRVVLPRADARAA